MALLLLIGLAMILAFVGDSMRSRRPLRVALGVVLLGGWIGAAW